MKKILILSFSDLSIDNRSLKQIKLLKDMFEVTAIGKKASSFEHKFIQYKKQPLVVEIFRLLLLLKKDYYNYYWNKSNLHLLDKLANQRFDIIIAHDERTLPLAQKIAQGAKVILDAHEYYPDVFTGSVLNFFYKKYLQNLYNSFIKKPDAMLTVANSISKKYYQNFNLKSEVILNLPYYRELHPTNVGLDKIKLVHHGISSPTRKIEVMIKMMDYLGSSYQLDLMLVSSRSSILYMKKLERMANKRENVKIINPVPYDKIVPTLNKYDIGLFLLPPTNFSLENALPNKFFEFIQARLAIAIGPSPEMAEIVKKYDIGIVSDNFAPKNLAMKIKSLNREQIFSYKLKSNQIAKNFTYESEGTKLINIINRLINLN